MAFLIDQLNNSGLFAQSAYSASIATYDSDGNIITATYLSSHQPISADEWNDVYNTVNSNSGLWSAGDTEVNTTVQNNSATWNTVTDKLDATAYTPFDPTYISGVVDNKLDTTAFSDVSGTFLTAHQPISADEWNDVYNTVNVYSGSWTGSESSPTASVDSNGSIDIVSSNNTVYFDVNGTWFNDAVNSALPTSSVQWNSNYDTVNTNSGVWGGSALNISAGEGVKVTLVNNNLVFSTDETVLFSNSTGATTGNLSEHISAFEKVKIYAYQKDSTDRKCFNECYVADNYVEPGFTYHFNNGTNIYACYGIYSISGNIFTYINGGYERAAIGGNSSATPVYSITSNDAIKIYKVIGINRKNNV